MLLTVGEVAEVLGLTSENIRYYVKEGLIKPARNTENNYRQYSSNDVLLISDIIFYRNMRIYDIIAKKRDGFTLSKEEIEFINLKLV